MPYSLLDKEDFQNLKQLILHDDQEKLSTLLAEMHPVDIAEIFKKLYPEQMSRAFSAIEDAQQAALVLIELPVELVPLLLKFIGPEKTAQIFEEVPADDAADILGGLSEIDKTFLLTWMEKEDAEDAKELLDYPKDTAGGIMTTEYVAIPQNITAAKAIEVLRETAPAAETVYYVYVVNLKNQLVGVISLRELIIADPNVLVEEVMRTKVISVNIDADQEEVARLVSKYDFLAIPVLDQNKSLMGIVTVDDVLEVFQDETTEDISRLAAISGEVTTVDVLQVSSLRTVRKRLPWLIVLMFVGVLAGNVIAYFEETLATLVALALFIPLINAMAGNIGTQTLTIVVRGLAIGEFSYKSTLGLLRREIIVGFIIGAINGILIAIVAALWQGSVAIGFIVGLSLWITMIVATLSGTLVPLALHRAGVDPAIASGPLITTINDLFAMAIYFSIATFSLIYFL